MHPIEAIVSDREEARNQSDPNAEVCFLALADTTGKASVRTLVLRDIRDDRVTLFINRTSPKWSVISSGGGAQILLWYPSVQRQYRLSGSFEPLEDELVHSNWMRRPDGSKYLDHVYESLGDQSSFVKSRTELEQHVKALENAGGAGTLSPPPSAAGIEMVCDLIERLDLNSPDRLHDRQLFQRQDGRWSSRVMIP